MNKIKATLIGLISSVFFFFIFGISTGIISNPFFTRMTPVYFFDYFFLIINSLLLGTYIGLHFYEKHKKSKNADFLAVSGGIVNVFVIGCPICNVLIISLIGTSATLNYFAPIQPILGVLSTTVILMAIYFKVKNLKDCKYCVKK